METHSGGLEAGGLRQGVVRRAILLVLAALAFHIAGSWSLPLIDRDEPRFAEAAREMLQRGDWIVPYFNNDYRFDKPPLIYWLQVGCYKAFGDNEFAARLPSAVAAALTCLLVYLMGRRMMSDGHAYGAALLFGFCVQSFIHGKAAVADMLMIFFFVASAFAGWWLLLGDERRVSRRVAVWLLLALLLGGGFLAKGPVAWLPVVALAVTAASVRTGWRFYAGLVISLAVASALVLVWAWPALVRTNGEYFEVGIGKHVVQRSVDVMEGHGVGGLLGYLVSLPLYFLTIFVSFFPGSIWLPWLAKRVFRCSVAGPGHVFLLAHFLVVFAVFTFVSTKLPHYILPGFPFLALMLAMHWQADGRPLAPIRRWCIGTALTLAVLALVLSPLLSRIQPSLQLAKASAGVLDARMEFASYDYQEPSLVWYFRKHVDGYYKKRKLEQVGEYLTRKGPRFVVLPTKSLSDVAGYSPGRWIEFRVRGLNFAKGKPVDLTMLVKTGDAKDAERD